MVVRHQWPREGISRIPYWVYTDPEIYAREQERIFCGRSWAYVALEAEIPTAGDFKRTTIGEKPVVVVRDDTGGINVVENRCAHRGVQFCQTHLGHATEFTCPYHQWTYNLQGNLIGVPFRRGVKQQGGMPADFALQHHGLRKLQVATSPWCRVRLVRRRGRTVRGLSRSGYAQTLRSRVRWPRDRGTGLLATTHPSKLEADVREHQGPLPCQPSACVPGHVRSLPSRQSLENTGRQDRPPRRLDLLAGRAADVRPTTPRSNRSWSTLRCETRVCCSQSGSFPSTRW